MSYILDTIRMVW